MTDFRALCAELHAAFNTYAVDMKHHDLLERARAALAVEAVGPSDDQIIGHAIAVGLAFQPDDRPEVYLPFSAEDDPIDDLLIAFARAVLARYGSAPRPIPVAERPWERDGWCDHWGLCWWALGTVERWTLCFPNGKTEGWVLPAHALSTPAQEGVDA
jgi:hypothetical protein